MITVILLVVIVLCLMSSNKDREEHFVAVYNEKMSENE